MSGTGSARRSRIIWPIPTAALEQRGHGSDAAASEAISRLGSPRDQAILIEQAEQSPGRLDRAIRRGLFLLVAEMVLWLFLSIGVTGRGARHHRHGPLDQPGWRASTSTVLESAEWGTNQVAIMACLGAFAAGRLSMGQLARISRHRDATLRKPWAVGGAAGMLVLVLLLPGYQDALTVVTLLVAPIAFVAGTLRPVARERERLQPAGGGSSHPPRGDGHAPAVRPDVRVSTRTRRRERHSPGPARRSS